MFKQLKNVLLLVCLLPAFLFASVSINGVTYNEEESELVFSFDSAVQFDNVILSKISLETDKGIVELQNGAIVKSTADTDQLVISLLYQDGGATSIAQKDLLESAEDVNDIYVLIDATAFIDVNNVGIEAVEKSDALMLTYNSRSTEPALTAAAYDAEMNELELTFNENVIVDEDYVSFEKIVVNNVELSIVGNSIKTAANGSTVLLGLGRDDQKALERTNLSNAKVTVMSAFRDEKYNPTDESEVTLAFTADANPLEAVSAAYDAEKNNLIISFNEPLNAPTTPENFFPPGVVIGDGVTELTLFGFRTVKGENGNLDLSINVPILIQKDIETSMDTDNLVVKVKGFTVYDANDNGNAASAELSVAYTEDTTPLEIDPANCVYDANINVLVVGLNDRLDVKEESDYTGITLIDPNDATKVLNFETVGELKVNSAKKQLELTLLTEQESYLESFQEMQLLVEPFIAFSKASSPNGNVAITADDMVMVNIVADTSAPVLKSVQYDQKNGVFIFNFDESVDRTTFVPANFQFAGVSMDGDGAVTDSLNSDIIHYEVSDAVQSALSQIADATKISPQFNLNANAISNFYDVGNDAIVNGEDGEDYLVGYGRYFWTIGKEKFPRGNQQIFASIRKIGEKADIFVADDQWSTNVTSDDVDSLLYAFEVDLESSELDATYSNGGVYNLVTSLFGAAPDYDGNDKVYILLYDVRDDWGPIADGRNDTNKKIFNPGYVESRDALSSNDSPLSNESDILYIDSYPQVVVPRSASDKFATGINALADVFHRLVALGNYPNEERWLVEGFSSLCQFFATGSWSPFMEDEAITNAPGNNLEFFVTEYVTRNNQKNSFLFNLYMYEKYGLDYITELMAYTRKTGLDRIDWVVRSTLDPGVTVAELFNDYAIASLYDKVEVDTNSGLVTDHQYGFINVDLSLPSVIGLGALTFIDTVNFESITKPSTAWSYFYYQIAGFDVTGANEFNLGLANDGVLKINGDDDANLTIIGTTQDVNQLEKIVPEFEMNHAEFNDNNEGELPLSFTGTSGAMTFRENYKTMIIAMVNTSSSDAEVTFTNDTEVPSLAKLSVVKNALIERYLDIYVTSNEALFNDITEGPSIQLNLGSNSIVDLSVEKKFVSGEDYGTFLYKTEYDFNQSGTYELMVSAKDVAGNEINVDNASVGVAKIAQGQNSELTFSNGFSLAASEETFAEEAFMYAVKIAAKNHVKADGGQNGDVYSVYASSDIRSEMTVKIPYDQDQLGYPETEIGLFRYESAKDEWVPVAGSLDTKNNMVIARIDREGNYQLQKGNSDMQLLPENFVLLQNYPNPFNPNTTIRFAVPEKAKVQVAVFNILGQKVKTLINSSIEAGFYTVSWDGTDAANKTVASGVYFYSLVTGNQAMTKKMVLIK